MSSRFREAKRLMRRGVHQEMGVPALYIAAPSVTPVPCTVRVWRKIEGQTVKMDNVHVVEPEDRIRFSLAEFSHALFPKAVVSIEPGEAYRIEYLYDADDGWQTARVTVLSAAEAAGLPVP